MKNRSRLFFAFAMTLASALTLSAKTSLVYTGTYTKGDSKGIYAFRFDYATGALTPLGLAAETMNAPFLTLHPDGHHLYALTDIGTYKKEAGGGVSAFEINPATGKLKLLNQQSNKTLVACHVVVDATGKTLIAASYQNGSVEAFPLEADGSIGPLSTSIQHHGSGANPARQAAPHAHHAVIDASNKYVFVPDLGIDKVMIYRLDAVHGKLTPNDPAFAAAPPGSGPRHIAFSPSGKFAYVINEVNNTVTAFSFDPAHGALTTIETVNTLPSDYKGTNTAAEIAVHPNGKFLYASNRGYDSIAVYSIDSKTGKLHLLSIVPSQGKVPRMFALSPDGEWMIVAHQDSNSLVVFKIDSKTGDLKPVGAPVSTPIPVCVLFTSFP